MLSRPSLCSLHEPPNLFSNQCRFLRCGVFPLGCLTKTLYASLLCGECNVLYPSGDNLGSSSEVKVWEAPCSGFMSSGPSQVKITGSPLFFKVRSLRHKA